jgi:NAD+ synthase
MITAIPKSNLGVLKLDCEKEFTRLAAVLKRSLVSFRKKGYVVGVSGGIDSSVVLGLCAKALGPERVLALQMPERHSAAETYDLSAAVAQRFGVECKLEEISSPLDAVGFYRKYDDCIRQVIPEYGEGWKSKIVLPNAAFSDSLPIFSIVAEDPGGRRVKQRLPYEAYLGVVAATNFKQRIRKMLEYYHADNRNFATTGTPNRLEYDLGFFVKLGDGAADVKPIAHLYKSQVYQMAEFLDVPVEIRRRPPTTDTYSLEQGQDEFFFSLPYEKLDLCLYGKNQGVSAEEVGEWIGLTGAEVERVYRDIDSKRSMAKYLHASPVLAEEI